VGREKNGGGFEGGQDPEWAVAPYVDGGWNAEYCSYFRICIPRGYAVEFTAVLATCSSNLEYNPGPCPTEFR
jgi:hypothetical protein